MRVPATWSDTPAEPERLAPRLSEHGDGDFARGWIFRRRNRGAGARWRHHNAAPGKD